jgi:hypothetical protein
MTLIDLDELDKLLDFKYSWSPRFNHTNNKYYAHTTLFSKEYRDKYKRKGMTLQSFILNTEPNIHIDHINHNTLDNRKENLRIISRPNNASNRQGANKNNSTGARNVNLCKSYNGYIYKVQIMKNGKRYSEEFPLNQFEQAKEWAETKRQELFGEFKGNG